jgi:tRNA threonylcarbamoyladenosine biosynthesis protein TsaB
MTTPIILAIETATDACSVALLMGDLQFYRYELAPQAHTHLILPMVESVIDEAKITLQEIDALSFGRGPGSFTGLRIAASIIQGLSLGVQKPIVPISTLRAVAQKAYRINRATHVLAQVDARMQERYWGLFVVDAEGIMQPFSEERVSPEADIVLPPGTWMSTMALPEAQDIATIAAVEYMLGHSLSAVEALPIYIRDNVTR